MSLVFCLVRVIPMSGVGTTCVLPFTISGTVYNECVPLIPNNKSLLCATTNNFMVDFEWGICIPGELTSLHCLYCKFKHYQSNIIHIAVTTPIYCHGLNAICTAQKQNKDDKLNYEQVLRFSSTVVISNIYAPVLFNILFASNKHIS